MFKPSPSLCRDSARAPSSPVCLLGVTALTQINYTGISLPEANCDVYLLEKIPKAFHLKSLHTAHHVEICAARKTVIKLSFTGWTLRKASAHTQCVQFFSVVDEFVPYLRFIPFGVLEISERSSKLRTGDHTFSKDAFIDPRHYF